MLYTRKIVLLNLSIVYCGIFLLIHIPVRANADVQWLESVSTCNEFIHKVNALYESIEDRSNLTQAQQTEMDLVLKTACGKRFSYCRFSVCSNYSLTKDTAQTSEPKSNVESSVPVTGFRIDKVFEDKEDNEPALAVIVDPEQKVRHIPEAEYSGDVNNVDMNNYIEADRDKIDLENIDESYQKLLKAREEAIARLEYIIEGLHRKISSDIARREAYEEERRIIWRTFSVSNR